MELNEDRVMEMNDKLNFEMAQMRSELRSLKLAQEQLRIDSQQVNETLEYMRSESESRAETLRSLHEDNEQLRETLGVIREDNGELREMISTLLELALKQEKEEKEDPKALLEMTTRQHVILQLILESRPYREVASRLNLSENTVKTQAKTIHKRLKTTNRPELFMKASRMLRQIPDQDYLDVIGIPKDWAKNYAAVTCEEDPYSELYKQSRGTNDDKENS